MGCGYCEQPKISKVRIWPSLMVCTSASSFTSPTLSQDAPQSHSYPTVYSWKCRFVAVFKVFIPASETLLLSSPIIHFMPSPDVCVYCPCVSILQEFFSLLQRIFTSSSFWQKSVTLFRKRPLKYRVVVIRPQFWNPMK